MPLIQIFTAIDSASSGHYELLSKVSRTAAAHFGKPERWVMTCLVPASAMTFGGTPAPSCFVAVKNIGEMSPDDTSGLSAVLCRQISESLSIPSDRIYIDFANATGYLWGWDGETFA